MIALRHSQAFVRRYRIPPRGLLDTVYLLTERRLWWKSGHSARQDKRRRLSSDGRRSAHQLEYLKRNKLFRVGLRSPEPIAPPTRPKPSSIIAQVAGSGTADRVRSRMSCVLAFFATDSCRLEQLVPALLPA
jgi:hypothetical protein